MYLRVDLPGTRGDDLKAIGEKFDINVSTIWPYVGQWPWASESGIAGITPLDDIKVANRDRVMEYMEKNKDFFGAHYGN